MTHEAGSWHQTAGRTRQVAGDRPQASDGERQTHCRLSTVGCLLIAAFAFVACERQVPPDAFGNVEATEVVVAAEAAGQLLTLTVEEGQKVEAGAVVGTVESAQLSLERDSLTAQRDVTASRVAEVARQVDALEAQRGAADSQRQAAVAQRAGIQTQLEIAVRASERTERLFAQQAATAQQRDQAERDLRVLERQLEAQDKQIEAYARQVTAQAAQVLAARAQRETAARSVASADAQVARVSDRLRRADIRNPSAGTVLVTFARAGEIVQAGQPLYKVADLSNVDVRAYVTEPQLASVKVGQQVQVTFDTGGDARSAVPGHVTWVASEAEFTPTPIQTRDERADLVYAIKVRVANADGQLKLGMPVDLDLGGARTGQAEP